LQPAAVRELHDFRAGKRALNGEVGKGHVGITARRGCRIPSNLPTSALDTNTRHRTVRDSLLRLSDCFLKLIGRTGTL
jgi:hypothetical protein